MKDVLWGVAAAHDDLHPGGKLHIVADMEWVDMPERLPAGFRAAAEAGNAVEVSVPPPLLPSKGLSQAPE